MSSAGSLDRRITLQRATMQPSAFSTTGEESWSDLVTLWAEVTPISDGERWRAGEVAAHLTHRFRVRWSSATATLTPKDRVLYQGRVFDVSGVKEIDRRKFVEITASARADT